MPERVNRNGYLKIKDPLYAHLSKTRGPLVEELTKESETGVNIL